MADRSETPDSPAPSPAPGEDRRDSGRVPIRLLVRDASLGGSFEERPGNLGLGGVYYTEGHPPVGNRVELRFLLPGTRQEVRAAGEILRVTREGGTFGAHVRFAEMPLETELALARYLQRA
ncbi:MAG TPA: PilZ domain-containing protein [Anaeromyxobacteraceae bacterium]|nr:PilZ domain-containing protein [Anaeromyxobacteraceae bacterium]